MQVNAAIMEARKSVQYDNPNGGRRMSHVEAMQLEGGMVMPFARPSVIDATVVQAATTRSCPACLLQCTDPSAVVCGFCQTVLPQPRVSSPTTNRAEVSTSEPMFQPSNNALYFAPGDGPEGIAPMAGETVMGRPHGT